MQFFCELLFAWNHVNGRAGNASELKPIPSLGDLKWLHHRIADSDIEMKFDKGPAIDAGLDRKPGASIGSCLEVRDWLADGVDKEVTGIDRGSFLESLQQRMIRSLATLGNAQRQINVLGGAC